MKPLITRVKGSRPVREIGKHLVAAMESRERADPKVASSWHKGSGAWALEKVRFFELVPYHELVALVHEAEVLAYPKRGLVRLADDDTHVWIVVEGGVKLCRTSSGGRRLIEAILGPGDAFGRVSSATARASYEVESLEPARVAGVARRRFEALLQAHPKLAFTVVQDLEGRQRKLVRRLEALCFKDVHTRLAETLLDLAQKHREPCSHGFALDIRITQQDLAELVGASRQMVSRVIGDFERRLLVQRMGRVLCILHAERLQRLAEGLAPAEARTV
jgi:CRP/FNR family cyclic AMP-dependent transcriptional regulator